MHPKALQANLCEIIFDGQEITRLSSRQIHGIRRDIQVIFQDPYSSLNPRMTAGSIIGEPLKVHGLVQGKTAYQERVAELLEDVG